MSGSVRRIFILAGHFVSTRGRFATTTGFPTLVLHDTTEFSFTRENIASVGMIKKLAVGYAGKYHTSRGILMHPSLVTTADGLPLRLAAIKFWSRDIFHGANALKRRINPTRVPIEKKESIRWLENMRQSTALLDDPDRCVHIGDRESDIYELFCSLGLVLIASPAMEHTPFQMKCRRLSFAAFTASRFATNAAIGPLHF